MYTQFDLMAADDTRLSAWRNSNLDGPRVLVCNGMGVPPEAWPRLIADGSQYQVAGWYQRGVLGSDRPADPSRVEISDHVGDAVALLDALGWEDAIIVAWSLGVNVAFELANEHPDRVAGLLSVAGVPGGTFDTLLAPQLVPKPLRRPLGLGLVRTGRALGAPLNLLTRVVPRGRPFAELVRHSGVMLPIADIKDVQPWVEQFFWQDWHWYFNLALALEKHGAIDPSFIEVPVTIVAGTFDALTAHEDVMAYAARIPHAEVHTLTGTHCLPLEYPDRIMEMLTHLDVRVRAHRAGQSYLARFSDLDGYLDAAGYGTGDAPPWARGAVADHGSSPERETGEPSSPAQAPSPAGARRQASAPAQRGSRTRDAVPWWASVVPDGELEPPAPYRPSPRLDVSSWASPDAAPEGHRAIPAAPSESGIGTTTAVHTSAVRPVA